ncbi:MAG TPA: DUF1361 domain-containing protein [Candidatus Sulfotelmatobacter sp.]|nr:DUF1361 domain-containing protein [Candidatus Sulfotelmatobacter sp.]
MEKAWSSPRAKFILALVISSLVSILLFAYRAVHDHSLYFDYLSWNLILAWLPLVFAVRLSLVLKHKLWSSWEALILSFLWLIFLPNSFYMISDFIHIQDFAQVDLIYDTTMITSFIYTGVALGFSSLYLIHLDLKKRFSPRASAEFIALTLFISSVAMYFGRDLRWTSWNVFTNPGGLLFDLSNRITHVFSYPDMVIEVIGFFVLLCAIYNLIWQAANLLAHRRGIGPLLDSD